MIFLLNKFCSSFECSFCILLSRSWQVSTELGTRDRSELDPSKSKLIYPPIFPRTIFLKKKKIFLAKTCGIWDLSSLTRDWTTEVPGNSLPGPIFALVSTNGGYHHLSVKQLFLEGRTMIAVATEKGVSKFKWPMTERGQNSSSAAPGPWTLVQ